MSGFWGISCIHTCTYFMTRQGRNVPRERGVGLVLPAGLRLERLGTYSFAHPDWEETPESDVDSLYLLSRTTIVTD
jgi:hypothetical protein